MKQLKLYYFLPILAGPLIGTLLFDEFLSTTYIIKMGVVLLLIIVSVILLIQDIKRKKIK